MHIKSILTVIFIYAIAVAAWVILGTAMEIRSNATFTGLGEEVRSLWGEPMCQYGPSFVVTQVLEDAEADTDTQTKAITVRSIPIKTNIDVDIHLKHRQKGLNWYPTYQCDYASTYELINTTDSTQTIHFHMPFPSRSATYDAFSLSHNQVEIDIPIDVDAGVIFDFTIEPHQTSQISLAYKTRGIESWSYHIDRSIGRVKNFSLNMRCNFKEYDYLGGSMSADNITQTDGGLVLHWQTRDRITRQAIAVEMPKRVNPGPLSARMTFFAPVCLIFYFALLAAISTVRRIDIHPMHYLFVACGFFAFHLLFAYLVDLLSIHYSFAISASATLLLVTTYLRTALRGELPIVVTIGGQLFFLLLFSYSFFLNGTTGLVVAIGSVLTLALMMRLTAEVDWKDFFEQGVRRPRGMKKSERVKVDREN